MVSKRVIRNVVKVPRKDWVDSRQEKCREHSHKGVGRYPTAVRPGLGLESMAGYDGKHDHQYRRDENTKRFDPHGPHSNQAFDVFLPYADIMHWRGRFGLLQEGEEGREGVVGRKEEVGGYQEWEDQLGDEVSLLCSVS